MQYLKYSIQLSFLSEEVKSFVDGLLVSLFRTHDGFFRYIFTFFFEFSADPWITIFFYVHYPFIHTWADRLHASRIYFQFLYFFSFFFCLFVCQAGVTNARSMSLSKANKQRNEQNGQDMYFFCPASWTSRAVQRKQKTLLCIIQWIIKNRLGRICGGHVGYADVNLGLTVRRKGFKMSAIICSGSTIGVTGYNGYYVVKATLNL